MTRPVRYPENGAWPALMRADMAAAFVDDRSVEDFLAGVKAGDYPPPTIVRSQRNKKWAAEDLARFRPKVDGKHGKAHPSLDDDM